MKLELREAVCPDAIDAIAPSMQKFDAPTDPAPAPGRVRSAGQRSPPSADQGLCVNPTDRPLMDDITHHRAMAAFCRQRARMDGENEQFWLAEADDWARRASDAGLDPQQRDSGVRR